LSVALSDNWTESWTLNPVADADALRRLSALYRFILGKSSVIDPHDGPDESPDDKAQYVLQASAQFMCDYPIPKLSNGTSDAASGKAPKTKITTSTDPKTGAVQTVTQAGDDTKDDDSITLVFKCLAERVDGQQKYKIRTDIVDRSQLRRPECVICLDEDPKQLGLQIGKTSQAFAEQQASFDIATKYQLAARLEETKVQLEETNELAADLGLEKAAPRNTANLSANIANDQGRAEAANQDAEKHGAEAKQKEVLIADNGAFEQEKDFTGTNTILKTSSRNGQIMVSPYLNPALIFGLVAWKVKGPVDAEIPWKSCVKTPPDQMAKGPRSIAKFVELGSYEFRSLYARCDKNMDPKEAFHEFELLVTSAAQVGTAVSGAPVVAIQTGNEISFH
jgi:hypothetical protein